MKSRVVKSLLKIKKDTPALMMFASSLHHTGLQMRKVWIVFLVQVAVQDNALLLMQQMGGNLCTDKSI